MSALVAKPGPAGAGGEGLEIDHAVIRASAGSGKTHQLAARYLQLIAAGAAPSSILATTFTRLAAGEIRDRILKRLAEAADDPAKRGALAAELGRPSLARVEVIAILDGLARVMHRMQVRTLDSFFASIVRAFAIELEMPLSATIIDEEDARQLRSEAVRLMLDEHDPQKLVDLLRQLTEGRSERGVTAAIDRVVDQLYSLWRESGDEPWDCVPALPGLLSPPQVIAAVERLESLEHALPSALIKAWLKDREHARRWWWRAFIEQGISCKVAAGARSYSKGAIPQFVIDAYTPLVDHAKAELVRRVREQTLATRDLLRLFHKHYAALKHRRRVLTFADLTHGMASAEALGTFDEIGFRLDATLQHVLLDEFQDTSIAQWQALAPIAHEMISHRPPERSFFCVGDAKQSIYGWRDAAPEVLDELPRLLVGPDGHSAVQERELVVSWRSAQPVIDVVNSVFRDLPGNAALSEDSDAAEAWSVGLKEHTIAERQRGLAGYAELRTAPEPEREATARRAAKKADREMRDRVRFAAAADFVAELHRAHPSLSIAVLTRTNAAVARVLYELGPSRRKIAASGRGGGPLTDAAPVNAILDLLQLADHPDDSVAAFHVAGSPLGAALEFTDFRDTRARRKLARRVRRQLLERGYQAVIAQWTGALAPACDPRELRRLLQLVELAGSFDASGGTLRPGGFSAVVEAKLLADAQPSPVQVMTIHQAKGLEFDAVVLPELDGPLRGPTPPVVFERGAENETGGASGGACGGGGETGPITRVCRYMNSSVRQFVPELDPLFERHRRRAVRESLSLLYVAMTRARQGLYMFIDPPTEKDAWPRTPAGVLRAALAPDEREADTVLFAHGDEQWFKGGTAVSAVRGDNSGMTPVPPQHPNPADSIALAPSRGASAAAALRGRSAEAASSFRRAALAELKLPDAAAREEGIAIHALFEQIEWLDDFALSDAALLPIVRALAPRRDEAWARAQVESFRRMLDRPAIRSALSRAALRDAAAFVVHREHPFARLAGSGEGQQAVGSGGMQTGRIDRLVVEHDTPSPHGRPISATIIDFKTDAVNDRAAACACAEHYRAQMDTYRAAAAEMLRVPPERISLTLLFVTCGETMGL